MHAIYALEFDCLMQEKHGFHYPVKADKGTVVAEKGHHCMDTGKILSR